MVGVPGKSQGCNTCRKRKIKCDGERPSCGQCRKGNRACAGYQRDRHFKNLSSLDHDTLIARVQPLNPITEPSAIIYSSPIEDRAETQSTGPQSRESQRQVRKAPGKDTHGIDELPSVDLLNLSGLFLYFVNNYVPQERVKPLTPTDPPVSWLQSLAPLQGTNSSFDLAISALSMVRLGRSSNNEALRHEGLVNYGRALEEIQNSLANGESAFQEQTLASCMALSIFEVLEASGENAYGWNSHVEGISRLFQLRGPEMHISESSHQLFLGFRPTGIIHALALRRATYLGEESWLTIPWMVLPESDFHHLLDIVARMPALVEDTERISREFDSDGLTSRRNECLKQNWNFHSQLENWYQELSTKSNGSLYTEKPASLLRIKSSPELNIFSTSLDFPTFEIARMHLFYWAALLYIYNNISIIQPCLTNNDPSTASVTLDQPSLLKRALEIATLIAQSMQYLLSEEMHTLGPQNVFFPLRIAMHVFSRVEVDGKEVRWCKGVFEEMDRRGYPFGKILSGWAWDDIPIFLSRGG